MYDGRLVIDPVCRTNDPHIYAAGSMTKYSRRFYAEHDIQKHYNSVEIGQRVRKDMAIIFLLPFSAHCFKQPFSNGPEWFLKYLSTVSCAQRIIC